MPYSLFKRFLTCLVYRLVQRRTMLSEGEEWGERGHIFLLKLGLWEGAVFLNDLLMNVSNTKN